jgi:hypothetical protein
MINGCSLGESIVWIVEQRVVPPERCERRIAGPTSAPAAK